MTAKRSWARAIGDLYVRTAPWTAGFFALLLLGLFTAFLFIDAEAFLSSPVVTQWAAAIATVSATIAAIGIATMSSQERKREQALEGMFHTSQINALTAAWSMCIANAKSDFAANHAFQPWSATALRKLSADLQALQIEKIAGHDPMQAACLAITIGQIGFALTIGPIADNPSAHAAVAQALQTADDMILVITRRSFDASDHMEKEVFTRLGQSIGQYLEEIRPKIIRTESPPHNDDHSVSS